jgi:hypothetical protein
VAEVSCLTAASRQLTKSYTPYTFTAQNYPRIDEQGNKFNGYLDDSKLTQHSDKIAIDQVRFIIREAIQNAGRKAGRAILDIPADATDSEINEALLFHGSELFKYFVRYCGDPAATAVDCIGRSYAEVAREQFHNRTLQKERMNSGWRYQFIAKDMAIASKRFETISDIGASEADFNATIKTTSTDTTQTISIYVSVKNRTNTMGGQDWPKAIRALEDVAHNDRNRIGAYLCVFGIAMEHGLRNIKEERKTNSPYSTNTEIWLSDYFWPFFTNYSYLDIIKEVVHTLSEVAGSQRINSNSNPIPDHLIETFGELCTQFKLLDDNGRFGYPERLAELFVLGIKNCRKRYDI